MTLKRLLLLVASSLGCGSGPMAAVVPVFGDRDVEPMSLEGTIETIDFQNINKAQGRYTYNVELRVVHEGMPDSPYEADRVPGEFRVRVHKVYWSQLDAKERQALAPEGPGHTMSLERWQDYAVGQHVTFEIATWGAGLGALRSPAPGLPSR